MGRRLASLMCRHLGSNFHTVMVLELATRQSWRSNVNRLTRTFTSGTSWKREQEQFRRRTFAG